MNEQPSDFPKTNPKHLRISFGIKVDDGFTLIRFPKSRKGRTLYQEKSIYTSDWQRTVCKEYLDNPDGSYQGHFDRPITCKVYMGSRPLSFSEYTNFTHTQGCNEYVIDKARYEKIDDLQKIKAFAASDLKEKLVVSDLAPGTMIKGCFTHALNTSVYTLAHVRIVLKRKLNVRIMIFCILDSLILKGMLLL